MHLHRLARVALDDAERGLVRLAALVQLHDRQAQAFLENLRRMDGGAARRDAADIAMMRHGGGVALQARCQEDRLYDVDVGQVLAAGAVGIVEDEDVAGCMSSPNCSHQMAHRVGKGAELHRQGQPLGDDLRRRGRTGRSSNPWSRAPPANRRCA